MRCRLTSLAIVSVLACACGDDDGPRPFQDAGDEDRPGVTLSIDPAAVTVAAGEAVTVTATIVRTGGFTGFVALHATPANVGLVTMTSSILEDETSGTFVVTATDDAEAGLVDVSVDGDAEGVIVDAVPLAVTIMGRIGTPIHGGVLERSGSSVALSADGTRVIIGSPNGSPLGRTTAGLARVFERTATGWVQVGDEVPGELAGDHSGTTVAISNDGSRIAIGADENDGGGNSSGHVRVFDLVGTTWTQVGADIDGASGAQLGASLGLTASGSRLVAGAPQANSVNGAAYVYELVAGTWTQVGAAITGDHETGYAVDISDDGSRIAVSSPSAQSSDMYQGHVQVYELSANAWTPLGPIILGAAASARNGVAQSLSADGTMIAIGSSQTDGGATNTGSVRVFRYSAVDTMWIQVGATVDGPAGGFLGSAVSLSADGTRIFAGAPNAGGSGQLYTFTQDAWVLASGPSFGTGAATGTSVSISRDGKTAAIGAPIADSPKNQSGEVRLYGI